MWELQIFLRSTQALTGGRNPSEMLQGTPEDQSLPLKHWLFLRIEEFYIAEKLHMGIFELGKRRNCSLDNEVLPRA